MKCACDSPKNARAMSTATSTRLASAQATARAPPRGRSERPARLPLGDRRGLEAGQRVLEVLVRPASVAAHDGGLLERLVRLDGEEDDGDVVLAPAAVGRLHEVLARLLQAL